MSRVGSRRSPGAKVELGERERAVAATAAELEREAARLRDLESSLDESREGIEHAEALSVRGAELETRRAELDRQVEELVEVERRSAEALAGRAAEVEARAGELGRRAAELDAREAALEERLRAVAGREHEAREPPAVTPVPVVIPADLRPEQERLEAKARTLAEAESRLAATRAELTARESAVQLAEENAAREGAALESRASELAAAEQRNAGTERRAAELDDRATLLAAREAELADSLAALGRRERKLDELEIGGRRGAEPARGQGAEAGRGRTTGSRPRAGDVGTEHSARASKCSPGGAPDSGCGC